MNPATLPHFNSAPPTAEEFADTARRRRLAGYACCAGLSIVAAVVASRQSLILAVVLVVIFALPVLLWRFPKFGTYAVIGAVCLFETQPVDWPDSFTDRVPFFWNLNTILQVSTGEHSQGAPLNILEILLLAICGISIFRAVYTKSINVRLGRLFWPIAGYMAFVGYGWVMGVATGGDFKISLQEVRSQFYLLVAYLMAVNLIKDSFRETVTVRRNFTEVRRILWLTALAIGFKGVLYTIRRLHYITFGGMALPDQGVGSHEEAFFFDCFIIMLTALSVCDVDRVLRRVMWALLPFVVVGDLACNRRAATAAFAVVIPMLLFAAYQAIPNRRRLIVGLGLALIVGMSIYYPIYKDRYGMLAQPARAIKSQFDPDPRDKSSNEYRVAEEADLYATIKSTPVLGYGYGKRMLHAVHIADISKIYIWWDIIPHNGILWIWMRVGTLGFIAFWLMIAAVIVDAARTLRGDIAESSPSPSLKGREFDAAASKSIALCGMLVISALLVFGLLDLQLSNLRDMLFAGTWAGMIATLPRKVTA